MRFTIYFLALYCLLAFAAPHPLRLPALTAPPSLPAFGTPPPIPVGTFIKVNNGAILAVVVESSPDRTLAAYVFDEAVHGDLPYSKARMEDFTNDNYFEGKLVKLTDPKLVHKSQPVNRKPLSSEGIHKLLQRIKGERVDILYKFRASQRCCQRCQRCQSCQ